MEATSNSSFFPDVCAADRKAGVNAMAQNTREAAIAGYFMRASIKDLSYRQSGPKTARLAVRAASLRMTGSCGEVRAAGIRKPGRETRRGRRR